MRRWSPLALVVLIAGFLLATLLWKRAPKKEVTFEAKTAGVDIVDKPGARPPRELRFTDHTGRAVTLGDYVDGKHPTILVLAYYKCPMLCSLVLNGVLDGIQKLAFALGTDFRVVTVSFDPRDDVAAAAGKRQAYVEAYGRPVDAGAWDFLVGDEATVKLLAESVGFSYKWDADRKEYAHAAGIFVLTPDGRLARTMYGVKFSDEHVRLALTEASEGRLGTTWDRFILFCYHWDPNASSYALAGRRLMQVGGGVIVLGLVVVILLLRRRERHLQEHPAP